MKVIVSQSFVPTFLISLPKSEGVLYSKAESPKQALLKDFNYLHKHAQLLLGRCAGGMEVIMSNATLRQSERAIRQARGVAKLTIVAFVYIPLSFTTTFFGMKFSEIASGKLSIWIWFVTLVPVFVISVVFLFWDVKRFATVCRKPI